MARLYHVLVSPCRERVLAASLIRDAQSPLLVRCYCRPAMRLAWVSLALIAYGCGSPKKVSIRVDGRGTSCSPLVVWSISGKSSSLDKQDYVSVPFEEVVTVPA